MKGKKRGTVSTRWAQAKSPCPITQAARDAYELAMAAMLDDPNEANIKAHDDALAVLESRPIDSF